MQYRAITMEKYGGCYGNGTTPQQAWDNLIKAMKENGSRWEKVSAFVIVRWDDNPETPYEETLLIGFGALSKLPNSIIDSKTAKRRNKVAELVGRLPQ